MKQLELLRAELERTFDLAELTSLCQNALGFDPELVGGRAAVGTFSSALVSYAEREDAVEALVDALRASGKDLSPEVVQLASDEPAPDVLYGAGATLGGFHIVRRLGEGRLGATYQAKHQGTDVRLKVLHPEAARDRRALSRFLVSARMAGAIGAPGLPRLVSAGTVDDRVAVAHEYVEGQPLAQRVQRTGPMHLNEARPLIRALVETVVVLHQRRLVHGAISLDNVVTFRAQSGETAVALLDIGTSRLRTRQSRHGKGLASTGANPRTVSPEQIQGAEPDARSDLYSLGAVLYELLSGKPPFDGETLEMAFSHLSRVPASPSQLAPRGWITPDVDDLVLTLLSKDPARRGTAQELLLALETVGRQRRADDLNAAQVEQLEQNLLGDPANEDAAHQLESAVGRGATAEQVGQSLRLAASMIDDPTLFDVKTGLLLRAARLLETRTETLAKAEEAYLELLGYSPQSEVAFAGLEEVRRRAGKHEELVEMLLLRAEAAPSPEARANAMGDIGRIYLRELNDREQAVVAYSQAFCDDPIDEYAAGVERAAGSDEQLWAEALHAIGESSQDQSLPVERRTALLLKAGIWYRRELSRNDLALPCLQSVLAIEPSNEGALSEITEIYRRAQQWQELGMVLTHRADAAATPSEARAFRVESAEILEQRLGDLASSRAIYEGVLSEDASHARAGEGLSRILEKLGDFESLVKFRELSVTRQSGADAVVTLCQMGELYEDRLGNLPQATSAYERALALDPGNLDALRGIERLLSKQGKFKDLVQNLETQVSVAVTPKQRITLLERIAAIDEEEFLDHRAAARALERALALDPTRASVLGSLARIFRVLERWEDASDLYARQMDVVDDPKQRAALGMTWGRLLAEQLNSPERAVRAYELVIDVEPEHAGALEALARLRESVGDAGRALEAILTLADQADDPKQRAEHYLRAAQLLGSRGDKDGAIEHLKNALDCAPDDRSISARLRKAYVERGDVNAAVEMLERELETTEGERAQAKLAGEMARLWRERLKDPHKAESAAERALRLDPSNVDALLVLGETCFEQQRYVEASAHLGRIADRVESLGTDVAVRVLEAYVDALSRTGSTEGALAAMDTLLRLAPDDAGALGRVAEVTFEHGSPRRAAELYTDYMTRFGARLGDRERARATYRLGEALRRAGDVEASLERLEEAADLDPGMREPLTALAQAYTDLERPADVISAKSRELDVTSGDDRVQLLVDLGDLYAKQGDRAGAARSYVAALEERPDERRLLTKLMQLYSEERDWNKLVEVVVKLAEFVDSPAQRVKYLHTAALVTAREIGDVARAAEFFEQVLEIEPRNEKALTELIDIQESSGNYRAVEQLLTRRLGQAASAEDRVRILDRLGALYQTHLADPTRAAQALEAATEADPGNEERMERLGAIYATDLDTFREKGVLLQEALLAQNPYRQDAYKALRKIYTVARDADASWALCQVLSVLQLADSDEQRFYGRMRSETAAPAQAAFTDAEWVSSILHPSLDPLLTGIFSLIEPAVVRARAQHPHTLGLMDEMLIDPAQHDTPLAQTLYYAAGVLGVNLPYVYANPNDQGGLSYAMTEYPSLSLGRVGMSHQVPPQVAAFVAARQLAYSRSGLYLRHFVQTGTAMKAWLLSAIKLSSPQFPVSADIEGAVNENLASLKQFLPADAKDHLASLVSRLLQSGTALDLKKWVAAVDLTADRAGFVVCHDLLTATQVIQASDETQAGVPGQERTKQLVLYAASSSYFKLRRALGITVDA